VDHLRVGEHLIERIDGAGGNADRFESVEQVRASTLCG
jgi:hypothetical protein